MFPKRKFHCRITTKEGDLEKERELRLKEWQTKHEAMEKWIEEREVKFQDSGKVDHNLGSVRQDLTLVKVCLFPVQLILYHCYFTRFQQRPYTKDMDSKLLFSCHARILNNTKSFSSRNL